MALLGILVKCIIGHGIIGHLSKNTLLGIALLDILVKMHYWACHYTSNKICDSSSAARNFEGGGNIYK